MGRVLSVLMFWVLVLLFAVAIIGFMFSYTVRYNEVAVRTTFGKADASRDVITEPGLKFKAPSPIQDVVKYDTRLRVVETRSETMQTADDRQIVVEAFCTYKVQDPLKFFTNFSGAGRRSADHYRRAEEVIHSALRSALGELSRYRLGELFTSEVGTSRLPELEARVREVLQRSGAEGETGRVSMAEYGIDVTMVGVQRIVLPENTTAKVMERMASHRTRLAQELTAEGDAAARSIRAEADSTARVIRSFAQTLADEIRARGEFERAEFLALQKSAEAPELAEFLQGLRFMEQLFGPDSTMSRTTFFLTLDSPLLRALDPRTFTNLKPGQIPDMMSGPMNPFMRPVVVPEGESPASGGADARGGGSGDGVGGAVAEPSLAGGGR